MSIEWKHGRYYCNTEGEDSATKVYQCRKLPVLGFYLFPMTGVLRIPHAAPEEGHWVDCSTAYLRSEAIRCSWDCPLQGITPQHVGKVISYVDKDGGASEPCFLFALVEKVAFVMDLDGSNKIHQVKIDRCYPLQDFYTDIASRALEPNPLRRPGFQNMLNWVGKTDAYRTFTAMVESAQDNLEREDMLRLCEVLTLEGVPVAKFQEEVQRRYNALPESERQGANMYQVVYDAHKGPAKKWTPIEREIMRRTELRYPTPQMAWENEGVGPMPTRMSEVDRLKPKETPEAYISEKLGLYTDSPERYWWTFMAVDMKNARQRDMVRDYKSATEDYLEEHPDFDMTQLSFIEEEDKEAVFKEILGVDKLDPEDPYRAWMKNPPEEFLARKSRNPKKGYSQIFADIYQERHQ